MLLVSKARFRGKHRTVYVVALSRRAVDKEMMTPNLVPVSFFLKRMR
jgi:hypothetical protein